MVKAVKANTSATRKVNNLNNIKLQLFYKNSFSFHSSVCVGTGACSHNNSNKYTVNYLRHYYNFFD